MLKSINLLNPRKAQKRSSRSSLLLLHSFQQVSPATEIAGFRPEQQKQKRSHSSLLLHSFQQVSGRNCRFPAEIAGFRPEVVVGIRYFHAIQRYTAYSDHVSPRHAIRDSGRYGRYR
ncbi:hypothetical protein HanRHA438_Chr13g0599801 [Helianthus annuus]|nr:hypothetical protein HanIR_Chr13g0641491 [Helianthus annuus]KAJ0858321.1 hypothetical protein HanRHA438_Chr13g0599801 [Helianthus annuus]